MPNPRKNPIHIFRPGKHTAMQGQTIAFSESDLAASAAAYDPARHEAPLVIGHPAANAPAYGWVSGLAANADGLYATPRQVNADFAEMVASGAFKQVSASFYAPDAAANPVPGVYYLRHVGFLGAQPPAVKGLRPVEFADGEAGVVTLDFADDDTASLLRRVAELFRSLRDYYIDKEGLEQAEAIIPSWAADWLQEDAAVAASKVETTPAFQEPQPKEEPPMLKKEDTATPTAPAAQDPRVSELEKQVASFQEQSRRNQAAALVSDALAKGKLTPAQATGLVDFMASLGEADVVSFGEKGAGISQTVFMQQFLAGLPVQVDFSEQSRDAHDRVEGLTPQQAAQEALCYQEGLRQKGITISVTDAVAAVKTGKHKEAHHG